MLKRLFALGAAEWLGQLGGMVANAAVTLVNIALLAVSGWFIASMALRGLGGPDLDYFTPSATIRALAILRTLGRYGERVYTHDTTLRLLSRLRVWLYERLEPLAPAGLARYRGGDLLARLRADIDTLEGAYLRLALPVGAALLVIPAVAFFLARFSIAAALIDVAGLVVAGFAAPLLLACFSRRLEGRLADDRGAYTGDITDLTRGYDEWLVDDALKRLAARAEAHAAAAQRQEQRLAWRAALGGALATISLGATLVAVLWMLSGPVSEGSVSGPDLTLIALLVLGSFEAVAPLPSALRTHAEIRSSAARIFELAAAEPPVPEPTVPLAPPERFDLELSGVTLRYAPDLPPVLDRLDLVVPQGACLGITGPSGAGKTSLLSALEGFWPVEAGTMRVGGVDLAGLAGDNRRALYAVVPQSPYIFNTSIRENLLLARPGASEVELWHALENSALAAEIRAMPAGLETPTGEQGGALSGGQRRRLALARAFLLDAPILLLDEPTEGLDGATEQSVLEALARLRSGRTCLLVTHRPAALRLADQVLVLPSDRAGS